MTLCPECKALNPYKLLARPVHNPRKEDGIDPLMYLLKPTFSSLQSSAESCQLCLMLLKDVELNYVLDDIKFAEGNGLPTPIQITANSASGCIEEPDSMNDIARLSTLWVVCGMIPKREEDEDLSRPGLILAAEEDDPAATSGDVSGKILADDPASSSSFHIAQTWLASCLSTHRSCWSDTDDEESSTRLPTRVIEVGPLDGSKDPRLVIPGVNHGRYAALSHCWGKVHVIKTTRETFVSHLQNLPFAELPKTFQDAIVVTRHLDLQYLWIDSLCIIQDCDDDWRREASRMADVYTNSTVTIAATAAKDSSVGLIGQTKQLSKENIQVKYECKESRGRGKSLGIGTMIIGHRFTAYDAIEQDAIDRAPLNQRAWVLQERMLSRRTLHFATHQMYWECDALFASEDGTVYDPNPEQRLKQSFPVLEPPQPPSKLPEFGINMIERWCRVLEEYTQRAVTKDMDRLPALFGLVTSVMRRQVKTDVGFIIQREYLAGLWRFRLHIGLLWQARHGGMRRPLNYRAPSWSWASLEGAIQYDTWLWSSEPPDWFIHVEEAVVEANGKWLRPLGERGHVSMRGSSRTARRLRRKEKLAQNRERALQVNLLTRDLTNGFIQVSSKLKTAIYDPDIKFDMGPLLNDSEGMTCGTLLCKDTGITLGWCSLDEACNQRKQEVQCFLISRSKPSDVIRQNRGLCGTENILALVQRDTGYSGEFVRIGTGQIDRSMDWFGIALHYDNLTGANSGLVQLGTGWPTYWRQIRIF